VNHKNFIRKNNAIDKSGGMTHDDQIHHVITETLENPTKA